MGHIVPGGVGGEVGVVYQVCRFTIDDYVRDMLEDQKLGLELTLFIARKAAKHLDLTESDADAAVQRVLHGQ